MARSQVWTVSSPLLRRRAATSRKALESISRPPVPSHSTLLMALSEIEGPVAGLTAFARDTELREFSHRRTPTKADGFAQEAPKDAHLERTYPCSSVLIRVPYLSAFSAPLREIPGFGNYGIANLLIPESLNSSISTYRFRLKAYPPLEGSPAVPVAGGFR